MNCAVVVAAGESPLRLFPARRVDDELEAAR